MATLWSVVGGHKNSTENVRPFDFFARNELPGFLSESRSKSHPGSFLKDIVITISTKGREACEEICKTKCNDNSSHYTHYPFVRIPSSLLATVLRYVLSPISMSALTLTCLCVPTTIPAQSLTKRDDNLLPSFVLNLRSFQRYI
jgi:hypothetical protein